MRAGTAYKNQDGEDNSGDIPCSARASASTSTSTSTTGDGGYSSTETGGYYGSGGYQPPPPPPPPPPSDVGGSSDGSGDGSGSDSSGDEGAPKEKSGNGRSSSPEFWKEQKEKTFLYQKIDSNGKHLKFGITKHPETRYTKEQLKGGKLKIIAHGSRSEMLALERKLHQTLPIGPEEGQTFYIKKQENQGFKPPPY